MYVTWALQLVPMLLGDVEARLCVMRHASVTSIDLPDSTSGDGYVASPAPPPAAPSATGTASVVACRDRAPPARRASLRSPE